MLKAIAETVVVCDLCLYEEVEERSVASMTITVDAESRSLDVCAVHAAMLRACVEAGWREDDDPFPAVGVPMTTSGQMAEKEAVEDTGPSRARIAAWARENGMRVGDRGPIPAQVALAFAAANEAGVR